MNQSQNGTPLSLEELRTRLRVRHGRARQQAAWEHSATLTPLGVHSNFRYFGPDSTPVISHGQGSHIWDLDGNESIDFRNGYGAVILGHGFAPVCDAVNDAIRQGTVFTLATPWDIQVAERLIRMCPALEMVRLCNTGTEATLHALRLARAFTGREKVLKFEGHFHGMNDHLHWSTAGSRLAQIGPASSPIPQRMSRGIPEALRSLILTLPYNNLEGLERVFSTHGEQLAAVICEPVMGNAAGLEPDPEFWTLLRALCDRYGVVFILDEVKTGFRIAPGGAQEVYGIRPDLATYAKAMGNGFPAGAFGGRRDIMSLIGPPGVAHGGTFNANLCSMAAVDKTLELLEDGTILREVGRIGRMISDGFSAQLTQKGIAHCVVGPPQMWGILLSEKPVRDFRDVLGSDLELYERIMSGLHARGVMPEPDVREPWFMSAAHTETEAAYALECLEEVIAAL